MERRFEKSPANVGRKGETMKATMEALEALVKSEIFRYGQYTITLEYREPTFVVESRTYVFLEEDKKENTFTVYGSMDEGLLRWAEQHFYYWAERALVPLVVQKIERGRSGKGTCW